MSSLPATLEPAWGPRVTLVNTFAEPFNNAIATARTCYAARVITPSDVRKDAKAEALRDSIAASTYEAGHHTTLQHATFQFVLQDVSRQCIWSFLHAHPHYNSEQVSQRYVSVKPERALVPQLDSAAHKIYVAGMHRQMAAYQDLVQALMTPAQEAYFNVFRARRKHADDYRGAIKKKSQEVARYVLPVATYAYLYHTISGLTLHRYNRLGGMFDVPTETQVLIARMVAAVNAHDPLFFANIEDPLPLEQTPEYQTLAAFRRLTVSSSSAPALMAFDAQLAGKMAQLIDYSGRAEQTLALAVRLVLGLTEAEMDDDTAIGLALDPAQNGTLGGALNLTTLSKVGRTLAHPHYTFIKKLSHAADSQDQRHRATPGSRPILHAHYMPGRPDVVTPGLIAHSSEAQDLWHASITDTWATIDQLLNAGVSAEQALYLLPNATSIRFVASGDLMGLHHKWTSRLCYNAQEEIWQASLDEVSAVTAVHPRIGRYIMPPCGVRAAAKIRPVCPEGNRFCGVPVWKLAKEDYKRVL
jgi:thymidylate synthase ThyX